MLQKKSHLVLLVILSIFVVLAMTACSKTKVSPDGYVQLVSLKGNSSMSSKEFTISVKDNRFKIKTLDNNQNGLKGHVVKIEGTKVESNAASFSVGEKPENDSWPFNLDPGKYKITVESTGTKFEISMEEKAPSK